MSTPDEIRQLADRLDRRADEVDDSDVDFFLADLWSTDFRAAAVALRHHANLLDAIGNPEVLRRWSYFLDGYSNYGNNLRRIADAAAAVSPPPTPTCPTCGSKHPDVYPLAFRSPPCAHSWHQAAT